MNDTAEKLLEAAEDLCRTVGFNAFSYRDLAERVGVRTASIHYHFPSKSDLGRAMVLRYRQRFEQKLDEITRRNPSCLARWQEFVGCLEAALGNGDKLCLGSMLGAEATSLPPDMLPELRKFFQAGEAFIVTLLSDGKSTGQIKRQLDEPATAATLFAALQGALIASRASNDPSRIRTAGHWLFQSIAA